MDYGGSEATGGSSAFHECSRTGRSIKCQPKKPIQRLHCRVHLVTTSRRDQPSSDRSSCSSLPLSLAPTAMDRPPKSITGKIAGFKHTAIIHTAVYRERHCTGVTRLHVFFRVPADLYRHRVRQRDDTFRTTPEPPVQFDSG